MGAQGPPQITEQRNGGAFARLPPILSMLLVPALTAVIVVAGMAARFGQRLDTLEQAAETRWSGLNTRLGAEEAQQRVEGLALERHDERIDGLEERFIVRGRELALYGQDLSRLIGELRAELHLTQERLARMEAITGQERGR
jgi:hypothetical protein